MTALTYFIRKDVRCEGKSVSVSSATVSFISKVTEQKWRKADFDSKRPYIIVIISDLYVYERIRRD